MRQVKITKGDGAGLTTLEIIKAIARSPTEKGVSYDEMRNRLRILDVVEAADENAEQLDFEDSDHALLARLTKEFRFGLVKRELADIVQGIIEAPKKEPSKKTEKAEKKGAAVDYE
jgi:hypothetical protein